MRRTRVGTRARQSADALLLSMTVLGERLTASEWWAIAAIAAGIATLTVVTLRATRRGDAAVPPPTPLEGG